MGHLKRVLDYVPEKTTLEDFLRAEQELYFQQLAQHMRDEEDELYGDETLEGDARW